MKKLWEEWPLRQVQVKLALKYPCMICGFRINKGETYYSYGRRSEYVHEQCGRKYDLNILNEVHQL